MGIEEDVEGIGLVIEDKDTVLVDGLRDEEGGGLVVLGVCETYRPLGCGLEAVVDAIGGV